jgi:signal transduction histidine kinase
MAATLRIDGDRYPRSLPTEGAISTRVGLKASIDLGAFPDSRYAQQLSAGFPWLTFPKELERQYCEAHVLGIRGRARVFLAIVPAILVISMLSGGLMSLGAWQSALQIAPDALFFCMCNLLIWNSRYSRLYLSGVTLLAAVYLATGTYETPGVPGVTDGKLQVLEFIFHVPLVTYVLLGLTFYRALSINVLCMVVFFASALQLHIPSAVLITYLAYIPATAVVAAGIAYKTEHDSRRHFLQGHLIEELAARDALAQEALVSTARQAGMAEIANNVLHNIGNVLNSVNVSAALIGSKLRDSKSLGLARAVNLMNEHAADLGAFITLDERGKALRGYLNKLVAALAQEKQGVECELDSLTKSIDHIKEIVATQQSYSGVSSVVEPVKVKELLEDALRMNAGSIAHHDITIVKEFADVPSVLLDKHLMLQVLINLIGNAKHALNGGPQRPHQIKLKLDIAETTDTPRLRIRIEDNGEGIAPENLTRLFAHGFTTRKNGHGFGLHSCALAMKEMKGSITAFSEGLGRGAAFVLELPMNQVPGSA